METDVGDKIETNEGKTDGEEEKRYIENNNKLIDQNGIMNLTVHKSITNDDQIISNNNIQNKLEEMMKLIERLTAKINKMDEEIIVLKTENVALKEDKKFKDISCWEWIEKRYEMLKTIPSITEENISLKKHILEKTKFTTDIKNANKRINDLELLISKRESSTFNHEYMEIKNNIEKLLNGVILSQEKLNNNMSHLQDIENNLEWNSEVDCTAKTITGKQNELSKERNVLLEIRC
jgi:hypothetical protein